MSLKDLYKAACEERSTKVNSGVLAALPESAEDLVEWDLTNTLVGTKGLAAVLRVAEQLPHLRSINARACNLTSPATKELLLRVAKHPGLSSIDLSDNDIRVGGPELVELLKRNRRIVSLGIENTFLRPLFVKLIEIQLRKNRAAAGPRVAIAAGPPKIARFSFGDPPADGDNDDNAAFQAGEEDAFAAFGAATFDTGAEMGKKPVVPRRPTVCSEVYKEEEIDNFVPDVIEKDPKWKQFLLTTLERHELFSHLEDFELAVAIDAMNEASRLKGETLFEEGDETDLFYVIGQGSLELTSKGEHVSTLRKGATMNDLMLLYPGSPRETAVCLEDVLLFTLDRPTYRCVLSKASKKKRAMYEGFLNSVNFLKAARLTRSEILSLADSLKPASFEAGSTLIRYGEVGETFYIIVEGVVEVFGRDDDGATIKVCEFTVGDCIGELEFLNSHRCVADCNAKTFVRTAKMNRRHFEMVMGPVREVLARNASENTDYEYYRRQLEKMEKQDGAAAH